MKITGLTLDQFTACTNHASELLYDGNVIVHQNAHELPSLKRSWTPQCQARLTVVSSDAGGARTAVNGRRGPYACWHAYRDVLREVFNQYPNAVVTGGRDWRFHYQGRDGFLENYPATGNIGVGHGEVTLPELCDCPESPRLAWRQRSPGGWRRQRTKS